MFTRREKHVLVMVVLTAAVLTWAIYTSLITQQALEDLALIWLMLYVLPLGIYLLTDKERYGPLK